MKNSMSSTLMFNPLEQSFIDNPYAVYSQMREESSVHWHEILETWLVVSYEEAIQIYRSKQFSSDLRKGGIYSLSDFLSTWVLFSDPPQHSRLKNLFQKNFFSQKIQSLREYVEPQTSKIISDLPSTCDIMEELLNIIPVKTIAQMLGIPSNDYAFLKQKSTAITLAMENMAMDPIIAEEGEQAIKSLKQYFEDHLASNQSQPTIMGTMLKALDEKKITQEEISINCIALLITGHATTSGFLGNALYHFAKNHELWQIAKKRENCQDIVEELLRFDPPVHITPRIALEDLEIGGQRIQAGEDIWILLGSANRDSNIFANGDNIDFQRPQQKNIPFGHGIHFCLGAALARLQSNIILSQLLKRFDQISLVQEPTWRCLIIRTPNSLHLQLKDVAECNKKL
jgi:cytochrome P450